MAAGARKGSCSSLADPGKLTLDPRSKVFVKSGSVARTSPQKTGLPATQSRVLNKLEPQT